MKRLMLVAVATLLCAVSCGGASTPTAPKPPTAADVAAQPSDMPHGMTKCDISGDILSFVQSEQSADPNSSRAVSGFWATLQKAGAMDGYVAVYTDSPTNCTAIKSGTSDIAAATYKVAVNFVVQYKDAKSAADAYPNQSMFGFTLSGLRGAGGAAQEGTKTGLTANSISVTQPVGNQFFYIALWQNKAFEVVVAIINLDPAASKKVATQENSRIK